MLETLLFRNHPVIVQLLLFICYSCTFAFLSLYPSMAVAVWVETLKQEWLGTMDVGACFGRVFIFHMWYYWHKHSEDLCVCWVVEWFVGYLFEGSTRCRREYPPKRILPYRRLLPGTGSSFYFTSLRDQGSLVCSTYSSANELTNGHHCRGQGPGKDGLQLWKWSTEA